ncbi:hypothetical protein F5Y06DRAFT_276700 [Hypoxylon sp. FL0890]|nr:hypothetical protein F5Y06DRAFT_276700 [Hypoxylon sp. FL0890]
MLKSVLFDYICTVYPLPEPVKPAFENLKDDPIAYSVMYALLWSKVDPFKLAYYRQGPSKIVVSGSLKDWEGWKKAPNIQSTHCF